VNLRRRSILKAGLASGTGMLTSCGNRPRSPSPAGWNAPSEEPSATSAPSSGPNASPTTSPAPSGYTARLADILTRYLARTTDHPKYPAYAGAVVLTTINGAVTAHRAVGHALRYGPGPVDLGTADRVAMRPDSIFDLASITKVFTALLVLQQAERGRIDLAAPVASHLPEFTGTGKDAVTPAMLLAHTSGLPDAISLSSTPSIAERRAVILRAGLVSGAVPGTVFRYSDLNYMTLALLLEKVTGQPLDALVRTNVTGPLGLRDTGFLPLTWLSSDARATRLVATDAVSRRGLLRGIVHDSNADVLGGVAGHAGMFSTAADLAVVGQMLLNHGQYAGKRLLAEATVKRMLTNANPGLPRWTRTTARGPGGRPGRVSGSS